MLKVIGKRLCEANIDEEAKFTNKETLLTIVSRHIVIFETPPSRIDVFAMNGQFGVSPKKL